MRIIINGACGRMGSEGVRLASEGLRGAQIVCGIDQMAQNKELGFECFSTFSEAAGIKADCVIDFSHHSVTESLLSFCVEEKLPVVVATTGHDEREIETIRRASEHIPVFFSANMSLGVALLCELAKTAAKTMPEADIEIIE